MEPTPRKGRCWGAGAGIGLLQRANVAPTLGLTDRNACAVRSDGSIGCHEFDLPASAPTSLHGAALSDLVSNIHGTCVLRDGGPMVCWGDAEMTAIDAESQGMSFRSITGNSDAICGLRLDGGAHCFARSVRFSNRPMLEQLNADAGNYRALAMSSQHLCVLRDTGRLACWGSGEQWAVEGPNASSETFAALATDNAVRCALSTGGRVTCWFAEDGPQSAQLPQDFTQIALHFGVLYGLRRNGSVYAYGQTGAPVSSGFEWSPQRFTQLVSSSDGVCALSTAGEVVCRGQVYLDGGALVRASRVRVP